jgi:hypothetical protein
MINLSAISIGEALSSLRDLIFIIGLSFLGWRARSYMQPVFDFFKRANHHMDIVETGMNTLLTNHMHHLQADAKSIKEALVPKRVETDL